MMTRFLSSLRIDYKRPLQGGLLFIFLTFMTSPSWAQTIFQKPTEALKVVFQKSESIESAKKVLSEDQKQKIKKETGESLSRDEWVFYVAKTKGQVDGYALIDHEIGKTEPITFMTFITPEGAVKEVEILVYRETHGSEVREKKFMKQFYGKDVNHPIMLGKDIIHMSGATLSSRAIAKGVKRDLALWETFYGTSSK